MVMSKDQKLIQCQGQSRVKVKLSHKGNSFLCKTLKNNFLKNVYASSVTSLPVWFEAAQAQSLPKVKRLDT